MTARLSSVLLSRRRLLVAAAAVAGTALTAMAGLSPAQSADGRQNGGNITFLID